MRPFPTRARVAGPPSRRAPALTLATALVATLIGAVPAVAAAAPTAPKAEKSKAASPTEAELTAKATAEAKRTGKRVEITSQRSENEEVWANPDGSFNSEQSLVPTRVYRNGKLVPVDTGLQKLKDGRIAPKATRSELTFSGGGNAPLVTMRKDGREVTLTWPTALPAPTLDGNSATYAEVIKGVDLRVAADATGFSHQLVVKTREAAANPALASLDFGLKGNGVTLRKEANGELQAVDPAGKTLFSSAKPQMWDSGADRPAAAGTAAAPAAPKAPAAKSLAGSAAKATAGAQAPVADAPAAPATPAAPAAGAPAVDGIDLGSRQADLGVELKGDKLTLTTDRKLLTAPDTAFPVVIDPVWRDDWKSAWAVAYKHNAISGSADTNYWNGGTLSNDARVGCAKDAAKGNAVVCAKTFFQIGMGELHGKQILDATFRIQQKSAGSWSCNSGDIQIWDTGTITRSTTWNNQPSWSRLVDASGQSYGGRNCPGDSDTIELKVTSAVADAARWNWPAWTMGLKSATDTVDVSWRKMNPDSARISTQFNTLPNLPSDRSMDPYVPCTGGQMGTSDEVVLRARISDAEDNALKAEFHYWNPDNYGGTLKATKVDVANGNVALLRIPASDLTAATYRWDVRGLDAAGAGPWAGQCVFSIDHTRPSKAPGVTSAQYPRDNPDNPTFARTEGTFTLSANGVSDVTRYQWNTIGDPTPRTVNTATPGGPAEIKYTPTAAGPQSLFVWSLDAAGNRSDATAYLFYAKRPLERDKHGDVNGDGATDIWSMDQGAGRLWMVPGKGAGTFGEPRQVKESNFGNAVSLTQWGSWNGGDFYEDLVVLKPSDADPNTNMLYAYLGAGDGELQPGDATRMELKTRYAEDNHWAQAQQAVAIGSVNDDNLDGKIGEDDQPDLLVKEGANLWLYFGTATGSLTPRGLDPMLLGNADWQDMTLSAPGDLNGDGLPEIWARSKTTGKIHQYTSRKTTDATAKAAIDLTVYTDPAARTTSIGTGFAGTAWPHLTSLGDFENDGFPDLWSRDNNGVINEFPGRQPANGSAFGPARQIAVSGTPWSECENVASAVSATGTHKLCGPILAKFRAKGGTTHFGKPSVNVTDTADGGKFVHLRTNGNTSDNASIYWHPTTGAWLTMNGIRQKWMSLGAEKSFLGYPTSDENNTFDQVGWFTTFTGSGGNGAIYWAPDIGSWSVHGTVYKKYLETGGPGGWLGYPTTDETNNPDGIGRYNHFRHRGQTSDTASIYWTTTTGKAWSVRGSIRVKWLALGAEKSFLGYPQSDEYDVYGGPREDFKDGSYIRHNHTTGVSVEHQSKDRTADQRTDLAGDFNGDGLSDMATVYDYGSDAIALYTLPGKADGGVSAPVLGFNTGRGNWNYSHSQWVAGDFNGDGRDDLAALYGYSDGSNGLFTFLGNADGTFNSIGRSAYVAPGNWSGSSAKIFAGDFNGDGRDDVGMMYDHGSCNTGTHTFLAKADGTFNASFGSWKSGNGNWCWNESKHVTGDFNGDGRDDMLALYGHGNGSVEMYTLLGKADGGFAAPVRSWNRAAGIWDYNRSKLTSGDYNGDGRADAAIVYRFDNGRSAVYTLTGKPDGGVNEEVQSWSSPEQSWYLENTGMPVSGDINKDGRDDIAIMYNYYAGGSAAFTFKGRTDRTDGGFEPPLKSWEAPPGTW
ncbi:FG-GAP-like repeat-containing protein [Streptomyces sp. NBC_00868]|uniref:FG-GAP-like repeat-containing protein n=1 Tax=unclassified Streptomyces TaxID=2593676 RepID=UPI003250E012|nr:FG-GAP-like repeat-containing protein [Streptomyces sp. NBC_00868]